MVYLSWILAWFVALSGLRINAESLTAELGCKIGSLPIVYFGLPLEVKHNSLEGSLSGKGITFPRVEGLLL